MIVIVKIVTHLPSITEYDYQIAKKKKRETSDFSFINKYTIGQLSLETL